MSGWTFIPLSCGFHGSDDDGCRGSDRPSLYRRDCLCGNVCPWYRIPSAKIGGEARLHNGLWYLHRYLHEIRFFYLSLVTVFAWPSTICSNRRIFISSESFTWIWVGKQVIRYPPPNRAVKALLYRRERKNSQLQRKSLIGKSRSNRDGRNLSSYLSIFEIHPINLVCVCDQCTEIGGSSALESGRLGRWWGK